MFLSKGLFPREQQYWQNQSVRLPLRWPGGLDHHQAQPVVLASGSCQETVPLLITLHYNPHMPHSAQKCP